MFIMAKCLGLFSPYFDKEIMQERLKLRIYLIHGLGGSLIILSTKFLNSNPVRASRWTHFSLLITLLMNYVNHFGLSRGLLRSYGHLNSFTLTEIILIIIDEIIRLSTLGFHNYSLIVGKVQSILDIIFIIELPMLITLHHPFLTILCCSSFGSIL